MHQEFRNSPHLIAYYRAMGPLAFVTLLGVRVLGKVLAEFSPSFSETYSVVYPDLWAWTFGALCTLAFLYAIYRFMVLDRVVASDLGLARKRKFLKERVLPWTSMARVRVSRTRSGKITWLQITGSETAPMWLPELDDTQRLLQIARDRTGLEPEYVTRIDWNSWGILFITMIIGCLILPAILFANMYLAVH